MGGPPRISWCSSETETMSDESENRTWQIKADVQCFICGWNTSISPRDSESAMDTARTEKQSHVQEGCPADKIGIYTAPVDNRENDE